MPSPNGARLWTGKVMPSTSIERTAPAKVKTHWRTGDEGTDRARAHMRIEAHPFTVDDPRAPQCMLCGSYAHEKVAGKLIHPDPRPVRPQRPAWTPPEPAKLTEKPKKRPPGRPRKKREPSAAIRDLRREKGMESSALGVMIHLDPTPQREATRPGNLLPTGDYPGEWMSNSGRFLVEQIVVQSGRAYLTRFVVTDMKYQLKAKKTTVTVNTFDEAQAVVDALS
jgi:hypothetical protein